MPAEWVLCFPVRTVTGAGGRSIPIGKKICIKIPMLIRKFDFPPNPDPWVKSDLLKPRFVKDLQILATIDMLAEGLSSGLKGKMQDATRGLVNAKEELPSELEINFGKQ